MTADAQRLRGKHLHLDCFAGIAGDMFLGAALDLGVPQEAIRRGLARLPLSGYELRVSRALRMGIEGCDLTVEVSQPAAGGHRHWSGIREMIQRADLPAGARQRALSIFGRIARAEARLHGVDEEQVHFHEVGAVDSIVDIVGAALALEWLSPARVTSRAVPTGGGGTTRCEHGPLPVPAPATLQILAEARADVQRGGADRELCTPTGAAIAADSVEAYLPLPAGQVLAVGYGAGDDVLQDRPNLLRLILFEPAPVDEAEHDAVVLEANIDNMSPELCGHLMQQLFDAGARDVWFTPITMKKGRPALTVSALCAASLLDAVGSALLQESTSIGLRHHRVGRRTLSRAIVEVDTPYGRLQLKVASEGERQLNVSPEYESCRAAAEEHGVPLKEVYAAALAAYRENAH
jgi:uncharacterized protein (TIGR00299 family) protein